MARTTDCFASLRKKETLIDHTMVEQDRCVYCGALVVPRRNASGTTHNLDHFIPIDIIIIARASAPSERIANYLLPCCPRCNSAFGECFFANFIEKFDYGKRRTSAHSNRWLLSHNYQFDELVNIRAPTSLLSMIRPSEELQSLGKYNILVPQKRNGRWERVEKALAIPCNHRTFCGGL